MFTRDDFTTLKAGDQIAYDTSGRYYSIPTLTTVERTTETLIIVHGRKFRKTDGYEQGNRYDGRYLIMPTEERVSEWKLKELVRKLKNDTGLKFTTEQENDSLFMNEVYDFLKSKNLIK